MRRYSRREVLAKGGAAGAAALAPSLLGAGSAGAARRLGHGGRAKLDSTDWLWEWEERMVGLGNRFAGTASLPKWVDLIEDGLQRLGLSTFRDQQLMPASTPSWNAIDWKLRIIDGLKQTSVPVGSYFPYSGQTPRGGITAEVVDAGAGLQADFAAQDFTGKIAMVTVPYPPPPLRRTAPGSICRTPAALALST